MARRFLLTLWLAIAFSGLVLGALAAVVLHLTPPLDFTQAFLAQFSVGPNYLDADQPAKSHAFELSCLFAPVAIVLAYGFAGRLVRNRKAPLLDSWLRLAVASCWIFFLWALSPLVSCASPAVKGMPPWWLLSGWFFRLHPAPLELRLLCLGLEVALAFLILRRSPSAQGSRLAFYALLGIGLLVLPSNIYAVSQIANDWPFTYHFNVVLHAVSQVVNGHHLLIQFPHIYGGYIEFLGPIVSLFPRRVETLLALFPVLNAVALLCLLLTARLLIRHPATLLVTGLALLAVAFVPTSDDHYYPYAPIRTLFPSVGLLAAVLYFKRPCFLNYVLASVSAALAPIWNLDTGIVLWVSWTAATIISNLALGKLRHAAQQLGLQVVVLIIIGIFFLLYLRIVSGFWPDIALLVPFQKLVLGAGYFCVPMLVPDAWLLVLMVYLVGLVSAFAIYQQKASTWRTNSMVMVALLGTGLFLYFTGRSVESNLVSVSYPAILLGGILISEARSLILLGRLPRLTWAFLLPLALTIGWWAIVGSLALPNLVAQSARVLMDGRGSPPTPFLVNAAFVQRAVHPGEEVFMLSNQSGFYSYLSRTACPINLPGPGEWLLTPDMNRLIDALNAARFPKLIVDQNFFTIGDYMAGAYRPDIYRSIQQAIATHYRIVATSPTGQVTLCIPR